MVFAYWLAIALLNQIPFLGAPVATVMLPAFSVSFMIICDELAHGRPIGLAMLLAGFRRELSALITMGGLYLVAILLVLGASTIADGGTLWHWVVTGTSPPPQSLRDGSLSRALLLAAALGTPVMMAFWFAPALTAWKGMGAAKALFYSFFAAWRNWRAFVLYGAMLAMVGVGVSVAIGVIGLLTMARVVPAELLRVLTVLISIGILPMIFGSFYAGYCDIFPDGTPAESPGTGTAPPANP